MNVFFTFTRKLVVVLAITVGLITMSSSASLAQSPGEKHVVKIKPMFGFGGELEGKWKGGQTGKVDHDNLATFGLGVSYEYPLHRYVTVGGLFSFFSFNTEELDDDDNGRSIGLDIDVLIRGRYPLMNKKLEVYGQIPLGITMNFPNSDFEDYQGVEETAMGITWNMGLQFGLQYFFTESLGALIELGWIHRGIAFELELAGGAKNAEFSGSSDQFALNLGVAIAF